MSKRDDFEAQLSEKASDLALFRGLLEHAGWEKYQEAIKIQRQARLVMVGETPLSSFGDTLKQEFMKGEASGLGLAMKFVEVQIELLQLDVKRLQTAVELEEAHEKQTAAHVASAGRVDSNDWFGGSGLERDSGTVDSGRDRT